MPRAVRCHKRSHPRLMVLAFQAYDAGRENLPRRDNPEQGEDLRRGALRSAYTAAPIEARAANDLQPSGYLK